MPLRFDRVLSFLNGQEEKEEEEIPVPPLPSRFQTFNYDINTFFPPGRLFNHSTLTYTSGTNVLLSVANPGMDPVQIRCDDQSAVTVSSRLIESSGVRRELNELRDEITELKRKRFNAFHLSLIIAIWISVYHFGYMKIALLSIVSVMALFFFGFISVCAVAAITGI